MAGKYLNSQGKYQDWYDLMSSLLATSAQLPPIPAAWKRINDAYKNFYDNEPLWYESIQGLDVPQGIVGRARQVLEYAVDVSNIIGSDITSDDLDVVMDGMVECFIQAFNLQGQKPTKAIRTALDANFRYTVMMEIWAHQNLAQLVEEVKKMIDDKMAIQGQIFMESAEKSAKIAEDGIDKAAILAAENAAKKKDAAMAAQNYEAANRRGAKRRAI
jgi:hypothetical protein